jgi:hypothetical protein
VVWTGLIWLWIATSGGLVNTVITFGIQKNAEKVLSSCTTGGFSRRAQLHGVSLRLNMEMANQRVEGFLI